MSVISMLYLQKHSICFNSCQIHWAKLVLKVKYFPFSNCEWELDPGFLAHLHAECARVLTPPFTEPWVSRNRARRMKAALCPCPSLLSPGWLSGGGPGSAPCQQEPPSCLENAHLPAMAEQLLQALSAWDGAGWFAASQRHTV